MNQPTFADLDYESKKRKTRREKFLERMDGLIPWEEFGRAHPTVLSPMLAEDGVRTSCRRCYGYTACSCSTT